MKNLLAAFGLFFAVVLMLPALAQEDKLGKVTFPTSCDPKVQAQFERGVAMLHSFWYSAGDKMFRDVLARVIYGFRISVLFGLALRQTIGMVESLLRLGGLDWPVPDFSTLCRRQKTVSIQIPFRRAGGSLNLLVDSTGVKMRGDGEWQVRRHGPGRRRQWRKVHLAMDAATGDIRGVEFTSSQTGDSPVLPDLLAQVPAPIGQELVPAPLVHREHRAALPLDHAAAEQVGPRCTRGHRFAEEEVEPVLGKGVTQGGAGNRPVGRCADRSELVGGAVPDEAKQAERA